MDNKNELMQRDYSLDVIRIFASFLVVMLHTTGNAFSNMDTESINWNVMNIYNAVYRCGVPIFVMISGALFLNPNRSVDNTKLFKRNIPHLLKIFAIWSLGYTVFYGIYYKQDLHWFLNSFFYGYAHLWFLIMLSGLYMLIPILRKITIEKNLTAYFVLLGVTFSFLLPNIADHVELLANINNNLNFYLTGGYVTYFVGGVLLIKYEFSKAQRYLLYGIGMIALIALAYDGVNNRYFLSTSVLVLLLSTSIFVFLRTIALKNSKLYSTHSQFIVSVSNLTLGIYVIHPFVINVVHQISRLEPDSFFTLWWAPLLTFITWGISAFLSWIITKIPIAKRFLL